MNINFKKNRTIIFFFSIAAKNARLEEERAADEQRRAALQSIVPDLLRNNVEIEDIINDDQTDNDGSTNYLDLLLDEEEVFIREYRQRLIDDGMW